MDTHHDAIQGKAEDAARERSTPRRETPARAGTRADRARQRAEAKPESVHAQTQFLLAADAWRHGEGAERAEDGEDRTRRAWHRATERAERTDNWDDVARLETILIEKYGMESGEGR